MTESGIETGWMRRCAVVMCLFTTLWGALVAQTGATVTRPAALSIDLGDIPARPVSPEFAFDRFFQTRPLAQFAFSADNRSIYFLRSDGRVDNVFSMDLNGRSVRQLTHFSESVSGFLVDHQGRFLIIVKDKEGNENYDLYRFDLHSAELLRLTAAGAGDTTMVCGLSPDDRLLYYAQTRDQRREAGLWQIEISTGKLRQLLPGRGRTLDCDAVSNDGRYLLFGELIGCEERHLGVRALATGRSRAIVAAGGIHQVVGGWGGERV